MCPHQKRKNIPRLIAWEITRSCHLNCKHCRGAANSGPYPDEFTLDEIARVLDNVASKYEPIIILTGGEPMTRPDLFEIIKHSTRQGLRTVMATCGSKLDEVKARELKEAGIARISISLDGPDAESHDEFRGVKGAFESALAASGNAREAGLPFQINTTVTRSNVGDLERILELAIELGAVGFHPFLLVPMGRGEQLKDEVLNADEYERVLNRIYDLQLESPIDFKPTCAPHYYRIYRQREKAAGREVTPQTHGLNAMSRGCMGGSGFVFISHIGKLQICGFLEEEAGDLREADYDFAGIWEKSPLFAEVRDIKRYKGRCGVCEFWRWSEDAAVDRRSGAVAIRTRGTSPSPRAIPALGWVWA